MEPFDGKRRLLWYNGWLTCTNLPETTPSCSVTPGGDQRGEIVGPERWRTLFKPQYARIYDRPGCKCTE